MTPYDPAEHGWHALTEWPLPGQFGTFWARRSDETWRYGVLTDASHANNNGVVHGGVLMTVADHALSFLAWEAVERHACTTIQLNTHFLDAIHPGEFVEVRGEVSRRTRGLVFLRGEVLAHGGHAARPVGAVDGIWRVLRRSQ